MLTFVMRNFFRVTPVFFAWISNHILLGQSAWQRTPISIRIIFQFKLFNQRWIQTAFWAFPPWWFICTATFLSWCFPNDSVQNDSIGTQSIFLCSSKSTHHAQSNSLLPFQIPFVYKFSWLILLYKKLLTSKMECHSAKELLESQT